MRTKVIWGFSLFFASWVTGGAQQPQVNLDGAAIRVAIEQALSTSPSGQTVAPRQAGLQVDVDVDRPTDTTGRVTINLNQRALTYTPGDDIERLTEHIIESTARLTAGERHVEYRFLVDGMPLEQFVSQSPPQTFRPRQVGVPRRVVISAGHGWYRHETSATWRLQRDYFWGIVEDFVNWDITHYLKNELITSNFDVRTARNPDRNAGNGLSGHPRWEESARYYIKDVGAPSSTWDVGVDDYAKDINSRPFYANWLDAALLVSIHNNGGEGTGTETWFDSTNGHEAASQRLAEIVNRRVVAAIRSRYDPHWIDRGLRSCNACKGENRLATRPAVIVEIAFMDTKSPDNDALHSEAFKLFVAQAIRDGIHEFTGTSDEGFDFDAQVRSELAARAARDSRFGGSVDGSYGANPSWDPSWELRWLEFEFTGNRRVRLYLASLRTDRNVRWVGFWDPDAGAWRGWERI